MQASEPVISASQLPGDVLHRVLSALVAHAPAHDQLRQLHAAERTCRAWRSACSIIPVASHLARPAATPSVAWLRRHVPTTLALAADSPSWAAFAAGQLTDASHLELLLVRRNGPVLPQLPQLPRLQDLYILSRGVDTLDMAADAAAALPSSLQRLELCGYEEADGLQHLPGSLRELDILTMGTALDLRPSLPLGLSLRTLRLSCENRLTLDWQQLCALPARVELACRTLHVQLPTAADAAPAAAELSQVQQLAAMLAGSQLRCLRLRVRRAGLLSYRASPDVDGTGGEGLRKGRVKLAACSGHSKSNT